jgi:hypothetical protein
MTTVESNFAGSRCQAARAARKAGDEAPRTPAVRMPAAASLTAIRDGGQSGGPNLTVGSTTFDLLFAL